MVPLAPFCPINPCSPCSPIGPLSPKWPCWPFLPWRKHTNNQVCTKHAWTHVGGIWPFKHSMLRLYLTRTSTSAVMKLTKFLLCLQLHQRNIQVPIQQSNWEPTTMKGFAAGKWTGRPFLLAFLFPRFCRACPPDPVNRESEQRAFSWQKELSSLEVKGNQRSLLRYSLWPPQVQEDQVCLPFLSGQFHLCSHWPHLDRHLLSRPEKIKRRHPWVKPHCFW